MDVDQNDSSYDQVQHKKLGGSITLSSEQLRFHNNQGTTNITVPWTSVVKHQVSPVTYPKSLLKLVLKDNSNLTFQLPDRSELERIRNDITTRLQHTRAASNSDATASSKKRTFAQLRQGNSTSFEDLDPTVLAVTRSSLLAANPALRKQHSHLVKDTETLTEEDFWETHRALLEEEHARISGMSKAGASSFFASHLPSSGRITLGVEEMRQIFILYPAVHKVSKRTSNRRPSTQAL
jgi:transcription initiation factor TFIIH subunit 1